MFGEATQEVIRFGLESAVIGVFGCKHRTERELNTSQKTMIRRVYAVFQNDFGFGFGLHGVKIH